MSTNQNSTESRSQLERSFSERFQQLTTNITYLILVGFILILIITLFKTMSMFSCNMEDDKYASLWLETFRDGFLILTGILTTLIGYYFGNRGSESMLKQAEEVRKQTEMDKQELQEREERITAQSPVLDEPGLSNQITAFDFNAMSEQPIGNNDELEEL